MSNTHCKPSRPNCVHCGQPATQIGTRFGHGGRVIREAAYCDGIDCYHAECRVILAAVEADDREYAAQAALEENAGQ
jgi:hypothetical protein